MRGSRAGVFVGRDRRRRGRRRSRRHAGTRRRARRRRGRRRRSHRRSLRRHHRRLPRRRRPTARLRAGAPADPRRGSVRPLPRCRRPRLGLRHRTRTRTRRIRRIPRRIVPSRLAGRIRSRRRNIRRRRRHLRPRPGRRRLLVPGAHRQRHHRAQRGDRQCPGGRQQHRPLAGPRHRPRSDRRSQRRRRRRLQRHREGLREHLRQVRRRVPPRRHHGRHRLRGPRPDRSGQSHRNRRTRRSHRHRRTQRCHRTRRGQRHRPAHRRSQPQRRRHRRRPRRLAVGHQRQRPPPRHGPPLVGQRPLQPDRRLQLGPRPLQPSLAQREHAELVVEVRLLGDLPRLPRGLRPGPQDPLPRLPVQRRRERRGRRPRQQHRRDHVRAGQRRQDRVRLRRDALRRHRGVPGPPGVVPGGRTGLLGGRVPVADLLQLPGDPRGQPVPRADRGQQPAAQQLRHRRVGVGVPHQRRQVRVVRQLPAQRARDPQDRPRRLAHPRGQQFRRGRALGQRRQRYERRVARPFLEDAGLLVLVAAPGPVEFVALPQQRGRLDEAQRQPFRGEPQVPRPGGLLLRQRPADTGLQELDGFGPAEAPEEDLLQVRGVGGGLGVRGGGQQVGAFGGGAQQLVEGGAAHLQVVEEDDGPDLPYAGEQFLPVGPQGPLVGRLVHGGVQRVEQLARLLLPVSGQPYDPVGRDARAVGGDRVEEPGATGTGGSGEPYGAPVREQSYEPCPLLLARRRQPCGGGGSGEYGRPCGGVARGAAGGVAPAGTGAFRAGPKRLDLAAVDGVHREGEVTGRQRDHPRGPRGGFRRIDLSLCTVHDPVSRSRRSRRRRRFARPSLAQPQSLLVRFSARP
ncbi:hypothetical protein ABT083_26220 [Streptomyces goshikiensis]|uniref:hypothetical protein n=1 Tax=Streptomyces goshikiensis TaxID=1942 RepID=UPI00331D0CCB